MTQAVAMAEFWEPFGLEGMQFESFDRRGYWSIEVTGGEPDSAIYLGMNLEEIPLDLLGFSEYGVNFNPLGDGRGQVFESLFEPDRLVLFSHPGLDVKSYCTIFVRIG